MIHILLKNKLIALDVILPLLLEVKSKKNISFNIITFDEELVQTLESNVVLKKIVADIGNLTYVGRYSSGNKFYSKILSSLIKIVFRE